MEYSLYYFSVIAFSPVMFQPKFNREIARHSQINKESTFAFEDVTASASTSTWVAWRLPSLPCVHSYAPPSRWRICRDMRVYCFDGSFFFYPSQMSKGNFKANFTKGSHELFYCLNFVHFFQIPLPTKLFNLLLFVGNKLVVKEKVGKISTRVD